MYINVEYTEPDRDTYTGSHLGVLCIHNGHQYTQVNIHSDPAYLLYVRMFLHLGNYQRCNHVPSL